MAVPRWHWEPKVGLTLPKALSQGIHQGAQKEQEIKQQEAPEHGPKARSKTSQHAGQFLGAAFLGPKVSQGIPRFNLEGSCG